MTPEDEMYDLEDYSSENPTPRDGDGEENIHDQLPSVAEAKLHNTSGGSSPSKKLIFAVSGTFLVLLIIIISVAGAKKGAKLNVEQALNQIAFNPDEDFVEGNYQYRAKTLLLDDSKIDDYSFEHLRQRYAMYCLHHATSPNLWKETKGWKRKYVHECKWYGVMCDEKDRVTRIELRDNGLRGEVPPELKLIDTLEVLNLNANKDLTGDMPVCEQKPHQLVVKADCAAVNCHCCANCKSSVFDAN